MPLLTTRNTTVLYLTILAFTVLTLGNIPAAAGGADATSSWSRSGPVVGAVTALVIAPNTPSTIYAGITSGSGGFGATSTTGIYKSTDGGLNWSRGGLVGKRIYSLAIDPTNSNTVYAGTYSNGLYKSTDGGASWSGPFIRSTSDVYALAVDPKQPSVLYAGATNLGAVKSTDGGTTWNTINNGIHYTLHQIVINPANTNIVYAAGGHGSFGGVYKSTDAGANWAVSSTGIPDSSNDVEAIALSRSNTSIMYAATGGDVYKSTDAGASWAKTGAGLPNSFVNDLAVDPSNPAVAYAATGNGVFKTTDGGASWISAGLSSISVSTLSIDASTSNNLYAGTRGGGVLKSTDGGLSWSQSSNVPYGDAHEVLLDPSNPAVVYANSSDAISKSTNHGASWNPSALTYNVSVVPGFPTHKLIIDPANPATLFAGVDFVGVFKTTDGGATWNSVYRENTNIEALAIDPKNPNNIYLATSAVNLFKSADGGLTWLPINAPGDVAVLAVDPVNPSVIYAGTNFGVAKSTDGGSNWATINPSTARSNPNIISLLIDPTNTSVLYAAVYNGGAFRSADGGQSWSPVFSDVVGHALSFATDPGTPNKVFAGTDHGVYQSTDGGQTSSALTSGWPSPAQPAMGLAFDAVGKYLYAGTSDGVYVYQLSSTPTPTPTQTPTPTPTSPPAVQFSAPSVTVGEGDGHATITVTRAGDTSGTSAVDVRTVDDARAIRCDDTATAPGVAFARCDYATVAQTLVFGPGETLKTVTVPIIDDSFVEPDENVRLALSNPSNAALGAQNTTLLVIHDNDTPGRANPIDSTDFFVRMQYLDFLSREPDPAGLSAWIDTINRCPSGDISCDRVTVSRNFFLSQEFQLKGLFVFKFYKVSFGRLPTYAEIVADMSSVTGISTPDLIAKKAAFTSAWAQRPEFTNAFGSMSNQQFVDALMGRYGLQSIKTINPSSPDDTQAQRVTLTRADMVGGLNAGTMTRGQIVRAMADSNEVSSAEFNPAFVAMQYFGYLRRDPDTGGYNDWLRTINANPSDIRSMVNGFVNSIEYRLRFGQP